MSFSTVFILVEWGRADHLTDALSVVSYAGHTLYGDELLVSPPPCLALGQVGNWVVVFLPQQQASALADRALFERLSTGRRAFGAALCSEPLQVALTYAVQGTVQRHAVWTDGLVTHEVGAPLLGEEASEIPDEILVMDLMEKHAGVRWNELESATLVRLVPNPGYTDEDVIAALADVLSAR
jgi:hypothetical protein